VQCLFEEQTTLFHLAEHLSLLSLTVNVRNKGKPPQGSQESSYCRASGALTTSLQPMFREQEALPSASLQQIHGHLVFRESLQQHLFYKKKKA